MILCHGTFRGVQPPLADGQMGLKTIFSGAVTGEMLDGQGNGTFLQAILTILVTANQFPGDTGSNLRTLAVGTRVPGPAGGQWKRPPEDRT